FLFLWGAYIASILPAGNFIVPTGTIFGERLTYLPSVWLCLAAAAAVFFAFSRIERKISSKRLLLPEIFMGLAILAAVLRTSVRTDDWKSMRTLAVSAVETSPSSVKTWNNLAIEFAHQEHFEEAIAACDRALAIKPDFQSPKVNKIYYLIALKRYGEAKRELIDVLTNGSDDYDLYNKLAGILAREGKLREAAKLLRKSLAINPNQKQIADSLKRMEKDIH
ncbi:MAG: tetratricopeptide repeat protein, partial [Kiritimatiellaeota bacterium]|nr:tetratricopeptide repeat protein [Kiritimatiellota bacterium]